LTGPINWELDYLPSSVEIRVSLAGDYNNNAQVEQGDLDLVLLGWGSDVATNPPPPEWINQRPVAGLIDQGELDAVLLNWGGTADAVTATAVPEPSGLLLALCVSLSLFASRRFGL
jgi:hypothetical protein